MEGLACFEVEDSRQGCRGGCMGGESSGEASDASKVAGQHGAGVRVPLSARGERRRGR